MSQPPAGVELSNLPNGQPNPKYVDLLDEDKPVAGQKFACISFVSPEKILKIRELYNFQEYVKQWDMQKSMEKFNHFMSFVAYKYNLNFDNIAKDLQDFCKDERDKLFATTIEDEFKNFLDANEERLEKTFNEQHQFQTSTRGVKIRGCYPSQQEAELRCKLLREVDPHHDIYVGPVGVWIPFHPEAYKTGRVEYLNDELNQLMSEKDKNEKNAKQEFDKRVRETKEKAIEENKKKALESGNVLTQTIDENGNLVSVRDMNTTEQDIAVSNEPATIDDIRKVLFEGENIVTSLGSHMHPETEAALNAQLQSETTTTETTATETTTTSIE